MSTRGNKTVKVHKFFYEMNEMAVNYELWIDEKSRSERK